MEIWTSPIAGQFENTSGEAGYVTVFSSDHLLFGFGLISSSCVFLKTFVSARWGLNLNKLSSAAHMGNQTCILRLQEVQVEK